MHGIRGRSGQQKSAAKRRLFDLSNYKLDTKMNKTLLNTIR